VRVDATPTASGDRQADPAPRHTAGDLTRAIAPLGSDSRIGYDGAGQSNVQTDEAVDDSRRRIPVGAISVRWNRTASAP
jgi:YD repeat-containing protein